MPTTSRGRVHDVFTKMVAGLARQADAQAKAARGDGQRRWQVPDEVDPLDVPGVTKAFDREEIGANFEDVIADGANPGTVGDAISLKVQADYVAIAERGFRARHCTPVRLAALAAARRQGHGHPKGVLLGGVSRYVEDALLAGQG